MTGMAADNAGPKQRRGLVEGQQTEGNFLMSDTTTKLLWQQFYEMTEEQAKAEQAEDMRRLQSGEMSEDEALERAAAWDRAGQQQRAEADAQLRVVQLARAAGCPKDAPVIPWLLEKGLIVKTDGRYVITKQPGPSAA